MKLTYNTTQMGTVHLVCFALLVIVVLCPVGNWCALPYNASPKALFTVVPALLSAVLHLAIIAEALQCCWLSLGLNQPHTLILPASRLGRQAMTHSPCNEYRTNAHNNTMYILHNVLA